MMICAGCGENRSPDELRLARVDRLLLPGTDAPDVDVAGETRQLAFCDPCFRHTAWEADYYGFIFQENCTGMIMPTDDNEVRS